MMDGASSYIYRCHVLQPGVNFFVGYKSVHRVRTEYAEQGGRKQGSLSADEEEAEVRGPGTVEPEVVDEACG